ncbi:transcription factor RFX3 [Battus philenor]|uniref:transcription factor RFX3 n=1 Tax=Battus philenor TaxID=42288 RepID=UPI0035CF4B3A
MRFNLEKNKDFECAGDEVLVESSPPASPDMAARLAAPAQGAATGAGDASPTSVRELIVIPELPSSIHLQHAIQQVSGAVVEVNGDSSGQSSPSADAQHTYITVAMQGAWKGGDVQQVKTEAVSDQESEGGNGVNYHVQYVEPQELYAQGPQGHMEPLRSYPVYNVASVGSGASVGVGVGAVGVGVEGAAEGAWGGEFAFSATTEAPASPAPAARMPLVQWLLDHYETAEGVSLPRSTLYAHYLRHCSSRRLEPVNAASFGKLIRSVFVGLRTRRLGTRGNSKYHYYGIRAKPGAEPATPTNTAHDEEREDTQSPTEQESDTSPAGGGAAAHRQYFGCVTAPEPPALRVDSLPPDVPHSALDALRKHHREHGSELLSAVAALDVGAVERARRAFWRRPAALCRRALVRLCARHDVARWLRRADLQLHQCAVDLLLPDVLRPIPPHLTQSIRNFAKLLEGALSAGASGAPAAAARAQAVAAGALAAALRRYTSLNHLAQAARAVLTNHNQIQQMLSDLNRVDFRVVREQAAWACACGSSTNAHRLEADFKATLGRGATLEQWAAWLENCVRNALASHERRGDYTSRARRLLLDWSFYSSLVIRELTLRSAASFGSFHLIRLLYDEYVSYLIERRVAHHTKQPQIAVMQRALEDEEDDLLEEAREGEEEDMEQDHEQELEGELEGELEHDDQDWEWADEDDDDDEQHVETKKSRIH